MKTLVEDDFQPGMLVTLIEGPWRELVSPHGLESKHVEITRDHGKVFKLLDYDPPFVMLQLLHDDDRQQLPGFRRMSPDAQEPPIRRYKAADIKLARVSSHWQAASEHGCTPQEAIRKLRAEKARKRRAQTQIANAVREQMCDCGACAQAGHCADEARMRKKAPAAEPIGQLYPLSLQELLLKMQQQARDRRHGH